MDARINEGYVITDSIHVGETEFVFGKLDGKIPMYVTWACKGGNNYYWGHYFSDPSQKYTLEDQILKYFPREIAVTKSKIKSIQADMAIRNKNTHPNADGFSPMVIDGVTYTEKKGA
ncbi:MAG: hypothetical protein K2O11_00185, partial [Oscillospiraceae bacterium]|nr:hypothetical protein [Oscillospiraceae bacterium]